MPGNILTGTADYNVVRSKLGVTSDDLADSDIDNFAVGTLAEAMIEQLITDRATIMAGATNDKTFLKAAAICLVGALACTAFEMKRGRVTKQQDYEDSTPVDWAKRREDLLRECKRYILLISTHTHTRRKLLVAAGPTSASTAWPSVVDQWFARIQPQVLTWLSDSGNKRFSWENMP